MKTRDNSIKHLHVNEPFVKLSYCLLSQVYEFLSVKFDKKLPFQHKIKQMIPHFHSRRHLVWSLISILDRIIENQCALSLPAFCIFICFVSNIFVNIYKSLPKSLSKTFCKLTHWCRSKAKKETSVLINLRQF